MKTLTKPKSKSRFKILRKIEDGEYTVFENTNKDLVKKIRAVTVNDDDPFEYCFFTNCRMVKQEEDQCLCVDGKGKKFYMDVEEWEEKKESRLLDKINHLYPVHKYWNQQFGTVFGNESFHVSGNERKADETPDSYDALGCTSYSQSDFKLYNSKTQISLVIEKADWYQIMFCYFDKKGNYVNRDYNIDLEKLFSIKTKNTQDYLKEIEKNLPKGFLYQSGNMFFSADSVYVVKDVTANIIKEESDSEVSCERIGFEIDIIPMNKNGSFGKKETFNRPEQTNKTTKAAIMEIITPIVNKMGLPK